MQKVVESRRFVADDGEEFTVLTIQEYVDASSKTDPHATIPGRKRLELSSGEKLNFIDERTVAFVHRNQKRLSMID